MAKKLVRIKALRSGFSTPRISNAIKDKEYVTTEDEGKKLEEGKTPLAKIIGPYKAPADKKANDKK